MTRTRGLITAVLVALLAAAGMLVPGIAAPASDTVPVQVGVDEYTDEMNIASYEPAAENGHNLLYADFDKGWFALKNKTSGDVWYSIPNDIMADTVTSGPDMWTLCSQLVIEYIYNEDMQTAVTTNTLTSHKGCIENGTVKVEKIDDGICVIYGFTEIGCVIPVTYRLEKDYLTASIDLDAISEGNLAVLTAIKLLPAFGAGNWDAGGSLLVPDGSGALIDFNNGKDCPAYESPVYGPNLGVFNEIDAEHTEAVRLPVFATLTENRALIGIITEGDGSGIITAYNGNPYRGYNAVSAGVQLRSLETISMFRDQLSNRRKISRTTDKATGRFEVRFIPMAGEDANYVAVARHYREYLIQERGLRQNPQKPALALDFYGAVDIKAAILGVEYDKTTALTTFKQAETILSALEEKNVGNLAVRYLGWGADGMLNKKTPSKAVPVSALGGKQAFNSLLDFAAERGYTLYPDVDFTQFRSGSNNNAVKTVFNEPVQRNERMPSVYVVRLGLDSVRLLTPQNLSGAADAYLKSFAKLKTGGLSLASAGRDIYSNNSPKNSFLLSDFKKEAQKMLKNAEDAGLVLALEGANAYALPYAQRIYSAPVMCSGYDMFDHEIPFYQIVTHGYITSTVMPMAATANRKANILKAAESGSELLFGGMYADSSVVTGSRYESLYGTQYSLWTQEAVEAWKRYKPLLELVYDKAVIAHRELERDVMQTVFEGGVTVTVNYNNYPVTVQGITVSAEDYVYDQGGKA